MRGEDVGMTDYRLRGKDVGITDYRLRGKDVGMSDYRIRGKDVGMTDYRIRGEDVGVGAYFIAPIPNTMQIAPPTIPAQASIGVSPLKARDSSELAESYML
jgi:hypothetical protein